MVNSKKKKRNWISDISIAAKWHQTIAESLSRPVFPKDLSEEERLEKFEHINTQSQKHLSYSKALAKLATLSKKTT